MASPQLLDQMKQLLGKLKSIDRERLLRPSLGEGSLDQAGFSTTLDTVINKANFAVEYGKVVDESIFSSVMNIFTNLHATLDAQSKRVSADYVGQLATFTNQVAALLQQLQPHWTHFISAAIEARGFLEDEGIRKEYQKTVEEMKAQAEEALKHVKEESEKVLAQATKLANDIEERARRTAAHISVEEAQKQFKEAQNDVDKQVKLWGWLSAGSLAAFLSLAFYLSRVKLPDQWQWHVVYHTAIRITMLTAVGAAATFCLRIFRAQMHMSHHNRHRQRVANSMQAFVEAAITPEQRDMILAQLVSSVVDFGTSGLLSREDDAVYAPKMTIDSITRTIAQPPSKA
jgi:leucyl-tRNA synthetase